MTHRAAARPFSRPDGLPTVSVVIPTYNEGANIAHVLERMPPVEELVIVDACSDDGTVQTVLEHRPDALVIEQPPSGKGAAMRLGFEAASQDVVIALDGDGSMDPQEIPLMVEAFRRGFDLVKGSREALGGGSTDLTPIRRAGNRGLVALYNGLFGTRSSDLCYGFFGFRRDVLDALHLYADGFEIETQIMTHARLAGLSIAEVPSLEQDRLSGTSNLHAGRDGLRVLRAMLRARFTPGRERWRADGARAKQPVVQVVRPQGRSELSTLPEVRTAPLEALRLQRGVHEARPREHANGAGARGHGHAAATRVD